MSTVLLPYNMASEGADSLAKEMEIIKIRRENSRYKHKPENVVINWGCPERPAHVPEEARILNQFDKVAIASNKLHACKQLQKRARTPAFTTDPYEAKLWVESGQTVVARTVLNGHGGLGIVLIEDLHQMVPAPLYTVYVPKKSEYRVHIVGNSIIDITRKVLRENHPDKKNVNWRVRNHDNGFIFMRYNNQHRDGIGNPKEEMYVCPADVKIQALNAVQILGLDFGAVDVIYNQQQGRAYVLEVNTAPGIADTACSRYAHMLNRCIEMRWYREDEKAINMGEVFNLVDKRPGGHLINPFENAEPMPAPIFVPRFIEEDDDIDDDDDDDDFNDDER